MSQPDELFFPPGPQPPRLGAEMDRPPWLDAFTEPLNRIVQNTYNTSYDTAQTTNTQNGIFRELRDANNVLERLQTESQTHTSALLFIFQKEEAILTALRSSALAAAEQQAQEPEHSLISDILRWFYSLSFASCMLFILVAFIFLMVWYRATPRDLRSFVLGIYDLPVNSTSALDVSNILFRNPNWRTHLVNASLPLTAPK